jgi:hypothetical protein
MLAHDSTLVDGYLLHREGALPNVLRPTDKALAAFIAAMKAPAVATNMMRFYAPLLYNRITG